MQNEVFDTLKKFKAAQPMKQKAAQRLYPNIVKVLIERQYIVSDDKDMLRVSERGRNVLQLYNKINACKQSAVLKRLWAQHLDYVEKFGFDSAIAAIFIDRKRKIMLNERLKKA